MKYWKYFLLSIVVIAIDQTVKMLVYYNMELGPAGEINVIGDWFRLHYLLNPGMAFGLRIDLPYGKMVLTIFRVLAIGAIAWYMYRQSTKGMHAGMLWCLALILGGAMGNAIDSIFYGVLLEGNAPYDAPTPWFHGQVIDMLYFPMYDGYYPDWVPGVGGENFQFFRPVFNIADSSIFLGVLFILIFQRRFLKQLGKEEEEETHEEEKTANEIADETTVEATTSTDEPSETEEQEEGSKKEDDQDGHREAS